MKIKKNDQAYLLDLKIDIHANRDIHYQELALLFDKPKFLDLLPYLRKNYQVVNFVPLEDFREELENYLQEHFLKNTEVKIDLSKYTKVAEVKESFPEFYDFLNGNPSNYLPEMLDAECNLICFEFNRPPYFVDAIKQAVLCGAVNDKYFKPTKAIPIDSFFFGLWPVLEQVAIFVSPTSTYEDVEEEFRKAKELMKTDKKLSYYRPRIDIAPNIRKYRDWYWKRIKGDTYQEIADDWSKRDIITYLEVLKGVQAYEKRLRL